jgi:hypothetical protein
VEITANNDGTLTWKVKQFPEGLFTAHPNVFLPKKKKEKQLQKKKQLQRSSNNGKENILYL